MIMMAIAIALAVGVAVLLNQHPGKLASTFAAPAATKTTVQDNEFDLGQKLEIDDGSSEEAPQGIGDDPAQKLEMDSEEPTQKPPSQEMPGDLGQKLELDGGSGEKAPQSSQGSPSEQRGTKTLPISPANWPQPTEPELAAAEGSRYYPSQHDAQLTLTIDAIGLYNVPVLNSDSTQALNQGVIHLPETPMPWEEKQQKNVYLAGHRIGYQGTGSRLVFYYLNKLSPGDSIVLNDTSGKAYKYRVSEMFVVDPDAEWAADPVRNRDMLTLQTCTYPNLENRLIVRADRV
jgi:sortase A